MPYIPNAVISGGPPGSQGPAGTAGVGAVDSYTVGTSSVAGATTLVLDRVPTGIIDDGSFVAVGAMTTKCEVRRITGISSSTLTFGVALIHAHTAGEFVWVLSGTLVPAEWYGCKANDSSVDNSTGLMQASIDAALTSNIFGLTGHEQRYYSDTPLCFYDNSVLDHITFTVKTPFSIDPEIGLRNSLPDQFFVMAAGQFVTVTSVDTGANTITTSSQVGSAIGDRVVFYARQGDTLPAPLEEGRAYYLLSVVSGTTYTISIDRGGSALDFTTSGSGTTYAYSSGLTRIKWTGVTIEGSELQALNGLFTHLQQPARTIGLRIQAFPGPHGCWCLGGQQSDHFSTLIGDGSVGIMLQGGQFHYFHASNVEDCDTLVISDTIDQFGAGGYGRDVHFWGCHFEAAGIHTARTQTIIGDAAVSAGTFTLTFGGQTTAAINFDASDATIQAALELLSTIDPGDVTVTADGGTLDVGGDMRCDFAGQYAWMQLTGTNRMTVNVGGLTGGTYTMNYVYPEARGISIRYTNAMIGVHGGVCSFGAPMPNGAQPTFLALETTASTNDGYVVENFVGLGQTGNVIEDLERGITVPWGDTSLVADGCAERLMYFAAPGRHGGSSNKSWWLAGRLGGHVVWEEYSEQLQIEPTASLVIGNGTPLKALSTGATSVADGGTVTHSLGATPNVVNVTPSVSGEFVSVTALGATTFTVAIKKHDGSAGTTQTVYWEAKDI
jgi:hypothetical protein